MEMILRYALFFLGAYEAEKSKIIFVLLYLVIINLREFTLKGKMKEISFLFDFLILFFGKLPFPFFLITIRDIIDCFSLEKRISLSIFTIALYFIITKKPPSFYDLMGLLFIVSISMMEEKNKRLKEDNESLKSSLRELKEEIQNLNYWASLNDDLNLIRERNRISTELHDTVGHRLSAIILQLEALKSMETPQKGMIGELKDYSKETLEEVRKALRELKPKDYERMEFLINIQNLIKDFKDKFRLNVRLSYSQKGVALSNEEAHFLYRATEECLTNAIRHGRAKTVFIHINFSDNINLTIRDDGVGSEEIIEGMGLKGMRERARALLGDINYHSTNEGFRVNIRIKRGVR